MSKYPCGTCGIGAKHSSIACTGPCKYWYHAKCAGISGGDFKKLRKAGYTTWKCQQCCLLPVTNQNNFEDEDSTHELVNNHNYDSSSLNITEKMEDVHTKIKNFKEGDDLESSLVLAAEVGMSLLAENNQLKNNLQNISSLNTQLTQRIAEHENIKEIEYEAKIQELELRQEALIQRNSTLIDTLNEVEQQLANERLQKDKFMQLFEEHDQEKETIISNYEKEIKQLRGII
ncbi:hypothetical protein J6590_099483, partial [Homalodisca vitripennis]